MGKTKGETDLTLDPDAALKKLEAYGERFMSMFDDNDRRKTMKASTSGRGAGNGRAVKQQRAAGGKATASSSGSAGKPPLTELGGTKPKKSEQPQAQAQPKEAQRGPPTPQPGERGNASAGSKRKAAKADEIEAIMRAGKKAKQEQQGKAKAGAGKGSQVAAAAAAEAARQAAMAEALKRERKLFMSHKASRVHESVSVDTSSRARPEASADDAGLSPEDFQKLQMEVEKFAVSALDKKAAKQYKARMLARVGAKAESGPRTALSIGKGMARMAAKREARALEEAIETGMVQRKGLGKKRRALQAKNRDRGLMEAGPSFKNGILKIKPMKKTRAESGKLRLPKGVL